ncbi:hypothetical protein B566_EDAN001809 [Ephemera danica]|nr:hypothetical protein B566_EDAN001809 [Ephemera danica]
MFPTSFAMQFQTFLLVLLAFLSAFAQCKEIRRIHEITEGPYQNYSGQPLVDLGGLQDMWMSGTDLNIGGTFVWGSTGKRITFTDWHPGEPSGDGGEDCINYWFKDGVLKWNDNDCYNVMGVDPIDRCALQVPGSAETSVPTATNGADMSKNFSHSLTSSSELIGSLEKSLITCCFALPSFIRNTPPKPSQIAKSAKQAQEPATHQKIC